MDRDRSRRLVPFFPNVALIVPRESPVAQRNNRHFLHPIHSPYSPPQIQTRTPFHSPKHLVLLHTPSQESTLHFAPEFFSPSHRFSKRAYKRYLDPSPTFNPALHPSYSTPCPAQSHQTHPKTTEFYEFAAFCRRPWRDRQLPALLASPLRQTTKQA